MWLLLFGLTALVLVLPMLPAFAEWRRPTDVTPLHIDAQDALDPTWPARSAADRVCAVVAHGGTTFDGKALAQAPAVGAWPLYVDERVNGTSHRAWHGPHDLTLPPAVHFAAEVFASGNLQCGPGERHGALWAGRQLRFGGGSSVLRWAHGHTVDAEPDCRFIGRVTADAAIRLGDGCRFVLLQAPVVRFGGDRIDATDVTDTAGTATTKTAGFPVAVAFDALAGRGTCDAIDLGSHRSWLGDLVCRGDLAIGRGCRSIGNIKSRGAIVIGDDTCIEGALIAEGALEVGEGSSVSGSVVSETAITLRDGCRIGSPGRPATVSAPRIHVAAGVVVHGTLWAGEQGEVAEARSAFATPAVPVAQAAPDVIEALAA